MHRSFPRDSITCELQENEKSGGFILTGFFVFCNSFEYIKDREGAKRIRGSDVFASNTIVGKQRLFPSIARNLHAKNGPPDRFLNAWTVLQEVIKLSVSEVFLCGSQDKSFHTGNAGNVTGANAPVCTKSDGATSENL